MKSMHLKYKDGEITVTEYNNFIAKKNGYVDFNEYHNEWRHDSGRHQSMSENKECTSYLGIHISERLLPNIFGSMIRMPYGNIGYDVTCGKGLKIDVKSACLSKNINYGDVDNIYDVFHFDINRNKIADYFLLIAFDNRHYLNPLHIWLIKADEIINTGKLNDKKVLTIHNNHKSLKKYEKYEVKDKLDKLIECCDTIKGVE